MLYIENFVDEGELIDPVLSQLVEDDEGIHFSPGTYKLSSFRTSADDFGLIAPEGNVTLEIVGSGDTMLEFSGLGWHLQGFEFDFRNAQSPKQIRALGSGWLLEECTWRGQQTWDQPHPAQAIAARIEYERGEGIIRDCYFPDGSADPGEAGYGSAIQALPRSVGTLHVTRCWFEEWAESAISAARMPGALNIGACYVRNTTDGIHVSGPATISTSTFVNDGPAPIGAPSRRTGMRGWFDGAVPEDTGTVYVEDCDFYWDVNGSAGYPIDDRTGISDFTVYSSRIHNETPRPSIIVGGGRADFEAVEVSGTAGTLEERGGLIGSYDITERDYDVADTTAPLDDPPPLGETPDMPFHGGPRVGKPGGSRERFT